MAHRLLLLRHAKSSWDDPSLADRDRPLNKRGHKAAQRMGEHLRSSELLPDLILCSPARRTRETLERLGLDGPGVVVEDDLYGASEDEILNRLRRLPEGAGTVAVIGHNPAVQDLASALAGTDVEEDASRLRERFPTGALAVFELKGTWREIGPERARLAAFVVPRQLG